VNAGWILFGVRTPYSGEVFEILRRRGDRVAVLVDNLPDGPQPSDLGTVIAPGEIGKYGTELPVVIPLLTPGYRAAVEGQARALGLELFPPLLDPTAVVASSAVAEEGAVVNAGCVIGAGTRLGRFTHVNRSASIGHDNTLGPYTSIGPGAVLSGGVHLERGAFIGAGAICTPDVHIGANAVVGAGAVVLRDVPSHSVVAGNPARVLRTGAAGYNDVGV
jgi:sugar O-acyltransferase (sialic acid O-acetyltransferase NeuD family)